MSADGDGGGAGPQTGLPVSAQAGPYAEPVEAGKSYRWCRCGLSRTQPWCDDSHAGTGIEPIAFTAPISGIFFMCGCKRSENPPYCFGTCRGHKSPNRDGGA